MGDRDIGDKFVEFGQSFLWNAVADALKHPESIRFLFCHGILPDEVDILAGDLFCLEREPDDGLRTLDHFCMETFVAQKTP